MAGVAVTTLRAASTLFSPTYLDETLGFVVPDHSRDRFSSWEAFAEWPSLTIAVPDVPYYIDKLRQRRPRANCVSSRTTEQRFHDWDPAWMRSQFPRSAGRRGRCCYPQFSVVVPEPGIMKVPLAYPIGRHDAAFASFINTWIDLKRKDGTIDVAVCLLGARQERGAGPARWSIIRDVLHWVE